MQLFTGLEYLQIDIASNFGLDKKSWDERIAWAKANEDQLESLLNQAEEPALYFAGVQAYREVQKGNPIGYPISLDATASGLQILAVLTGDRRASSICNVVDTGDRQDAYTIIYNEMTSLLGEVSKIKREDIKQAIMTSLYGSTAVPKEVFGEGELLDCFMMVMEHYAPAVWDLNKVMLDIWNPNALSNDWIMPDNFHVHVKVMDAVKETVHFLNEPFEVIRKVNQPIESGRSLGANMTHSIDGMIVREMTRRCIYDPKMIEEVRSLVQGFGPWNTSTKYPNDQMVVTLWGHYQDSGYLSARILEHLNQGNAGHVDLGVIKELLDSLPEKPFQLMSIHDCFRCLPHYGNDLRRQYNIQLYLIARSNLLGFILGQLLGQSLKTGKLDPSLEHDVMAANYALS
jgi:hypothetical protein